MPDPCDETACCSGAGDIGGIVIDECGSAKCSIEGRPRFYHLPFAFNATVCNYLRYVYTSLRETTIYELSGNSADPEDFCYRDPGEVVQWGFTDTTTTADPYCVAMITTREEFGDQLQGNCANLTFDGPEVLEQEDITPTFWYRVYSHTADGGLVTFRRVVVLELEGEIDLESILIGCALENGFDKRYKLGCLGAVELISRVAIGTINLNGTTVSAGTSISGLATRPYRIIETTITGHCPTTSTDECESFPLRTDLGASQVDCVTLTPAVGTYVRLESGGC